MATPGTERRGVGLRRLRAYAVDTTGYIGTDGTTSTLYYGVRAVGAQELALTDPEPQKINHRGDDVILDVDMLPAQEGIDGSFTISGVDDDLDELMSDRVSVTEYETRFIGIGTNDDADIPQVAIVAFRQATDADGERVWESYVIPKAKAKPIAPGMTGEAETQQFRVYPQYSDKDITGRDFTTGTDGFSRAQMRRAVGENKLVYATARGDNSTTQFTFDSDFPASSTSKLGVYVDGTETTSNITKATNSVTWTTAPTTGAVLIFKYEYA